MDRERLWAQEAVENSWMNVTDVKLVGWKTCPTTGSALWVKVSLQIATGCGGATQGGGRQVLRKGSDPEMLGNVFNGSVGLGCTAGGTTSEREAIEHVAVHEFGHVLGYDHEQDYGPYASFVFTDPQQCTGFGDTANMALTAYDPDSVMYYNHECREFAARLSDLDIEGVQRPGEYGLPSRPDMDGDGIPNWKDNCPYVANYFQQDSNHDAELEAQKRKNPWPYGWSSSVEGLPPASPLDTAYIDHWHTAFRGDACDPVVSTQGSAHAVPIASS